MTRSLLKSQVNIIVVNHNYEEFISFSIESALRQTWSAHQVIVIDDGSTDGSRSKIAAFGTRIKPIFKEREGHTSAINTGFAACTGEFVLFLDADDLLYPTAIASALSVFQLDDVKVQFQLDTIDQAGVDQKFPFPYFEPGFSPQQARAQALTTGWYPWTTSSGNLYSRKYLQQIMPLDPKRVTRSPDSILNKLAPLYGSVRTLRQILGAYRVHGKNSWASTAENWTPQTAITWLKLNHQLEAVFLEHAQKLSIPVRRPLVHPFQKLEYEILAHRFLPHEPGVLQSLLALNFEAVRWFYSDNWEPFSNRLARLSFLFFLSLAPKELLKKILPRARGQKDRSTFWRLALRLARRLS